MESVIQRSFSLNISVMKIIRLYPPENHTRLFKVQGYILYFLFVILLLSVTILRFPLEDNVSIFDDNFNTAFMVQAAGFVVKLLPFIQNGERIKKCIHYFEADCYTRETPEQKKIVDDCVRICRRNSMAFFGGLTVGVIVFSIKPFFVEGSILPIDVWLPFDPTSRPITFYSVYLFMAIGIAYEAFGAAMIDPLIGGLACHAASQVKIVKDNLQHLNKHNDQQTCGKNNTSSLGQHFNVIYNKIKQCVDHHNGILKFMKEYEACFSLVVFTQFAISVFVICFSILQLRDVALTSINGIIPISAIAIILGQIYFYCYYGTMLLEENNSLADAIYMGKWYKYDVKSRKALITLMERSKRPMVVTAGKLLPLSLSTFTMILRRSYSLLALLKNYQ